MKDPSYRTCYKLWQFMESYDDVDYTIEERDTALEFDEEYLLQMYTNLITNYTVFKSLLESDPRKMSEIASKHPAPVKPKFIKEIKEEIVEDYNIPDVEVRKVIIEEVTQAQLDAEAKLEEETARCKEIEEQKSQLEDSLNDLLVSGTAADVAVPGKPFPDLFPRRIRIAHQKPFGRHDEPRRTEAALHARIRHERPLQRMKPFRRADALDGFDFRIRLDLFHLFDAGARDLPVEQQRTSAAVPGSAPDFRPGEPKTPHHVGKGVLLRLTKDFPIYPIDVQDDSLNGHGSSSVKGLDIFQTRRIALLSRKLERKAIRLRRASSGTAVLQRTGATCPRNP